MESNMSKRTIGNNRELMDTRAIAKALGVKLHQLYKKRQVLSAHGFPDPVPGFGKKWDPAAIDRWLDCLHENTCTEEPNELNDARRILQNRLNQNGRN